MSLSLVDSFTAQFGCRTPIIQAPMGGGFTTPELVAAACEAGALGSIGAPYLTPEGVLKAAADVRRLTRAPFAINLFVHESAVASEAEIERAKDLIRSYRQELGLGEPGPPALSLPGFAEQVEAVLQARPAVFSFTFGIPAPQVLEAFRARGIVTVGTATTLAEGLALEAAGVDAVCAQGSEAGAHRGTFLGSFEDGMVGTLALTSLLAARLKVPVIAAGGLMTGRAVAAARLAGAAAAQLGTAFLTCPEAGTSATHRQAILSPEAQRTAVTRAFSGRPARGIVNRFMRELGPHEHELPAFPVMNSLTRDLRDASAKAGRPDFVSLWAGQGAPLARVLPAAELVRTLDRELQEALGSA